MTSDQLDKSYYQLRTSHAICSGQARPIWC